MRSGHSPVRFAYSRKKMNEMSRVEAFSDAAMPCNRLSTRRRYDHGMASSDFPTEIILASEQRTREIEGTLMFRRRTIWAVHVTAMVGGIGIFVWSLADHTALMAPANPNFRAAMIGVGAFLGVLVAAVEREAWMLDIGRFGRPPPQGAYAIVAMVALVLVSAFGGNFVATSLVKWEAFHGLNPPPSDQMFTVVSRHSSRSGEWLDLVTAPAGVEVSLPCSYAAYGAIAVGERLMLPVQVGRHGIQRVSLPALTDLRRTHAI